MTLYEGLQCAKQAGQNEARMVIRDVGPRACRRVRGCAVTGLGRPAAPPDPSPANRARKSERKREDDQRGNDPVEAHVQALPDCDGPTLARRPLCLRHFLVMAALRQARLAVGDLVVVAGVLGEDVLNRLLAARPAASRAVAGDHGAQVRVQPPQPTRTRA